MNAKSVSSSTVRVMLRTVACMGLAALLWHLDGHISNARPTYKSVWEDVYSDFVKAGKHKVDCAVCHPGSDKAKLNCYGEALKEELGTKNSKDKEKIAAAIRALAKKSCQCGNWNDRLQQGHFPCENCKK